MARPFKQGLDYFSMDTNIDTKLELFEAEHGLLGFGFIVRLFQKIYGNGYYYEWNDDEKLLLSKQINLSAEQIDFYIESAFKRNIFDKNLYEKYKILTSKGIQKRYFEVSKRRKELSEIINVNYILVDLSKYGINVNNNHTKTQDERN